MDAYCLTSWALAVVDVILCAHPEEDDTSFAIYLYNIILFFYYLSLHMHVKGGD